MRRMLFVVVLAAMPALTAVPLRAQHGDDKLEDLERVDRRYLDRARQIQEASEKEHETEEEFLAFVETLIRDRNYRSASSERYRVQTDDPRLRPEVAVELLDGFRRFFDAFWADRAELEPYEKQSRVFLFYSFYKYNQLLEADFRFSFLRPKGHYGSLFDAITVHTGADAPADLTDTLVHEATHQLLDQRFAWDGDHPPAWIGEGMAMYFGHMVLDSKGDFQPAAIGTKQVNLYREGRLGRPRETRPMLALVREALKQADDDRSLYGRLLRLEDYRSFYAGNTLVNYGASWLLVHYLFHADEGRHAAVFTDWLGRRAAGEAGPGELLAALETTAEDLDQAVKEYVKQLRVR